MLARQKLLHYLLIHGALRHSHQEEVTNDGDYGSVLNYYTDLNMGTYSSVTTGLINPS
jgi:hypothetical protein